MIQLPTFYFAVREHLVDTGDRFLPVRGDPDAAGYDVRAAPADRKDIVIHPGQYFKIPLGFRSFCPVGWYYKLYPRSSSFAKKNLHNLIGIIDETWEGETAWAGQYIPDPGTITKDLIIKFGEPIAQIIPTHRKDVLIVSNTNEELDRRYAERNATRKDGGFGSTSS